MIKFRWEEGSIAKNQTKPNLVSLLSVKDTVDT